VIFLKHPFGAGDGLREGVKALSSFGRHRIQRQRSGSRYPGYLASQYAYNYSHYKAYHGGGFYRPYGYGW
jgi:hypothetical protein